VAPTRSTDRITIDDIAREANVSHATVSRVVNNKGYVSEEARARVNAAVTRTGYTVNRKARGLAGGRSNVVGLVVPDMDTSYIGEIIRGIDSELAAVNYDLMLYTTRHRKHRENAFVATLTAGLSDGLLLVLPSDPGTYLDSFRDQDFPCVLIDHRGSDESGPVVGATNLQGGYDATNYLLDLGHRRIGIVTGTMHMGCAVDRLKGYESALADRGIPFDPDLVREGDFHQPRAYASAQELLRLDQPPTAIFASNDVSAFGVMEAIRDSGRRIAIDVSVVGFDDIPAASAVNPPLTTVRQPLFEMGASATRMLLDWIGNPTHTGERLNLPTALVIRDSCRPPAG
jgi:LacI family transcriptional regulator